MARDQETRAIAIAAPASVVWQWVTQLGQDRGGFYSYRVLENLVGCEMPDVRALDPRLQAWRVGDKLWMYPPRKAGGAGFAELLALEPGRALGFGTRQIGTTLAARPDASWSFVVEPVGAAASRLVVRGRGSGGIGLAATLFAAAGFEPMHFVMERRTMTLLAALAEGRSPAPAWDLLQVALWVLTFSGLCAAAVVTLRGRHFGAGLVSFVAAGLLFEVLTLVQPHPALTLGVLLALVLLVVGARRRLGVFV